MGLGLALGLGSICAASHADSMTSTKESRPEKSLMNVFIMLSLARLGPYLVLQLMMMMMMMMWQLLWLMSRHACHRYGMILCSRRGMAYINCHWQRGQADGMGRLIRLYLNAGASFSWLSLHGNEIPTRSPLEPHPADP